MLQDVGRDEAVERRFGRHFSGGKRLRVHQHHPIEPRSSGPGVLLVDLHAHHRRRLACFDRRPERAGRASELERVASGVRDVRLDVRPWALVAVSAPRSQGQSHQRTLSTPHGSDLTAIVGR
jgi:hypothetical protein